MAPSYVGVTDWHLAQTNIGRLGAPRGDLRGVPFGEGLDRIAHSDLPGLPLEMEPDPRCVGNA
jgi:hypothetical protein